MLNNKDGSIPEEIREKVLRIVKEYNFKPFRKYIRNGSSFSAFAKYSGMQEGFFEITGLFSK